MPTECEMMEYIENVCAYIFIERKLKTQWYVFLSRAKKFLFQLYFRSFSLLKSFLHKV